MHRRKKISQSLYKRDSTHLFLDRNWTSKHRHTFGGQAIVGEREPPDGVDELTEVAHFLVLLIFLGFRGGFFFSF